MARTALSHNNVSYTDEQLMRIGRSVAGIYGGECITVTIKQSEKVVRFDCVEHGERFCSDVSFDDLAEYLKDAGAEGY